MAGLRAKIVSSGRDFFHPASPERKDEDKLLPTTNLQQTQTNETTKKSNENRLIELLKFENQEFQSLITQQDTYIKILVNQLRSHKIEPASWPAESSSDNSGFKNGISKSESKHLKNPSTTSQEVVGRTNVKANTVPNIDESPSPATSNSSGSIIKSKQRLDPKGGIHLSTATATAISAMASLTNDDFSENSNTKGESSLSSTSSLVNNTNSNDNLEIPERSARRRESVRIAHPASRFQERQEKERIQREQLEKEKKQRELFKKHVASNGKAELDIRKSSLTTESNKQSSTETLGDEITLQILRQEMFEKEKKMEEERSELDKKARQLRSQNQDYTEAGIQVSGTPTQVDIKRTSRDSEVSISNDKSLRNSEEYQNLKQSTIEKERREQESIEQEKFLQEKLEEKVEQGNFECERHEQERFEQERFEQERFEQERLKQERLEQEKLEQEKLEQERLEQERLERERIEQENLMQVNFEQNFMENEILERERLEQEKLQIKLEREKLEQERLKLESLKQERLKLESLKQERLEQEILEQERLNEEFQQEEVQKEEDKAKARTKTEKYEKHHDQLIDSSKGSVSQEIASKSKNLEVRDHTVSICSKKSIDRSSVYSDDASSISVAQASPSVFSNSSNISQSTNFKPRIRLPSKGSQQQLTHKSSQKFDKTVASPECENFEITTPTSLSSSTFHDQYRKAPHTPEIFQAKTGFAPESETSNNYLSPVNNTNQYGRSDSINTSNDLYSVDNMNNRSQVSTPSFNILPTQNMDTDSLFVKPEDFNTIDITVVSTLFLSANKKADEPHITLSVSDRVTNKEMWRIRKSYSQIVAFDNEIKNVLGGFGLPEIPDKSVLLSSLPAKVDSRKQALQNYFNTLFLMPHIPQMTLFRICKYLSLDFVNPLDDFKSGCKKEGYLIRKYKGLGSSWKIRWCQIEGSYLEIYEAPGSELLEGINLQGASIGRQSTDSVADEKGYRHAFLLLEANKSSKLQSSPPKHFFCAETDSERDSWIDCLVDYDDFADSSFNTHTSGAPHGDSTLIDNGSNSDVYLNSQLNNHQQFSTSSIQLVPNTGGSTYTLGQNSSQSVLNEDIEKDKEIKEVKKPKKRNYFPFKKQKDITQDFDMPISPNDTMKSFLDSMNLDSEVSKMIFGSSVEDGNVLSSNQYMGRTVPSIIFRCLDFLDKAGALYEEGIFRLSGSASTIKHLKDLFNQKYDVDLFTCSLQIDIHTISGLLKTYLRELPTPILGNRGLNDLKNIYKKHGDDDKAGLAMKFRDYFQRGQLKAVEYDCCYVIFNFLNKIIAHSQSNRMNLKNVCIVFVPTLNIPLDILTALLVDFQCIFEGGKPLPNEGREVMDLYIPNF